MGKKRELRKQMRERNLEEATALVICVGKKCCHRSESRALVDAASVYAAKLQPHVSIVSVGCLHVCKNGPIAATYPKIRFKRRVTVEHATKLVDKLQRRVAR